MVQKHGTKELTEMLSLVAAITKFIYEEARGDGLSYTDIAKLLLDGDFQRKLAVAVSGITLVDDEILDLDGIEGIGLARFLLDTAEDIISTPIAA
ncbi:hypothetical protein [Pseudobacteriovorax antillogorgiicola]|uniref:Uncharacterized protein n=1 Tax=Pseudobacteriovorax antillogorgiicola TaxID=1513793 RepID=A0A1Y6CPL3_9BACT|nr:hypothetical protein [Pseudobacteriovorax antillogorgiicola]TCS44232.1 hypothetical protein EDD56_13432 [Pseudobacteriovorax antillogorgiicola]SMF80642.1 hypothetical protein SAMN06296036_13533 [Pseudobacteriovorax antillogorgiicola]